MDSLKLTAGKVNQFLLGARNELRKVTWPTRKQALASTLVVIIVVVVVSLFLGMVDLGLTKIIKLILG